jgi:hypothetical protein
MVADLYHIFFLDPMQTVEGFLLPARTQLNIANETAQEIFEAVKADIELIR